MDQYVLRDNLVRVLAPCDASRGIKDSKRRVGHRSGHRHRIISQSPCSRPSSNVRGRASF
jgi:hypothetical protein